MPPLLLRLALPPSKSASIFRPAKPGNSHRDALPSAQVAKSPAGLFLAAQPEQGGCLKDFATLLSCEGIVRGSNYSIPAGYLHPPRFYKRLVIKKLEAAS